MYNYQTQKSELFTDEGQRMLLKVRDHVQKLLREAGAFTLGRAMDGAGGGDSFTMIACVDRLVELGEIVEIPRRCMSQFKVYASPQVSTR